MHTKSSSGGGGGGSVATMATATITATKKNTLSDWNFFKLDLLFTVWLLQQRNVHFQIKTTQLHDQTSMDMCITVYERNMFMRTRNTRNENKLKQRENLNNNKQKIKCGLEHRHKNEHFF